MSMSVGHRHGHGRHTHQNPYEVKLENLNLNTSAKETNTTQLRQIRDMWHVGVDGKCSLQVQTGTEMTGAILFMRPVTLQWQGLGKVLHCHCI